MESTGSAREQLQLAISEHEKIRQLADAYDQGNFAEEADNAEVEALKDRLWTLGAEEVAPIEAGLREQLSALDQTIARLDRISKGIDARHQACTAEKKQAELDFTALRKKLNSTNLSRGLWPIYGGVLVGVMAAWLASQLALGMAGCVIAGAAGYFVGNQLMQQIARRVGHPSAAKKDDSAERAALEELRGRYEELSREHDQLSLAQERLAKAGNCAEDIQFAISEALHELE